MGVQIVNGLLPKWFRSIAYLDDGAFSSIPRPPAAAKAPGLLISRSYGRVMPARFALRLAIRRAVPPPSLFPSRSLGAIGSPIP